MIWYMKFVTTSYVYHLKYDEDMDIFYGRPAWDKTAPWEKLDASRTLDVLKFDINSWFGVEWDILTPAEWFLEWL